MSFSDKQHAQQSTSSLLSPAAYPVYGTHVQFEYNNHNIKNNKDMNISAVYALPYINYDREGNFTMNTYPSTTASDTSMSISIKGIVILLHACTHNAFKFFSPSHSCPNCIGLSEELQMVRNVLNRGYVALAITCSNVKSGCWDDGDVNRVRYAVDEFIRRHSIRTSQNNPNNDNKILVRAIGASSGGSMAAKIMAEGVVDSALVMVMSLRTQLVDKLMQQTSKQDNTIKANDNITTTIRRLYFAPMTKDKGTAKRVRENYNYFLENQKKLQLSKNNENHSFRLEVILDEDSCRSLPVTVEYLWNRVPGMTTEASKLIVDTLIKANHIDPINSNSLLIVDPTKSTWRDLLKAKEIIIPKPLLQSSLNIRSSSSSRNNNDNKKDEHNILWGTFDLTPGISPLAKALHRAWAMHEYCSESVNPALDFFEQ